MKLKTLAEAQQHGDGNEIMDSSATIASRDSTIMGSGDKNLGYNESQLLQMTAAETINSYQDSNFGETANRIGVTPVSQSEANFLNEETKKEASKRLKAKFDARYNKKKSCCCFCFCSSKSKPEVNLEDPESDSE